MPSRRRAAAVAALLVGAAACGAMGGLRPLDLPVPDALVFLRVEQPAAPLIHALDSLVRARGLAVRLVAPREGWLETEWFDLEARATVPPPFGASERIVRLRFAADPRQGKSRLIAECVRRIAWDPSVPERDLERMVPPGHPGRILLDDILRAAAVTDSLGRPLEAPVRR
jgi:hypothetical protein